MEFATALGQVRGEPGHSDHELRRESEMKQNLFGMLGLVLALGAFANRAQAQDALAIEAPTPATVQLVPSMSYEAYEYRTLQRAARRSRNALIGTSVATAVGLAIALPMAAKCVQYDLGQSSDLVCPTRGQEAGLTMGAMVFWGGLIGTLTTGIMLGVRKGKMRRLDHQIAIGRSGAVRWDPARSRFTF